MVLVKKSFRANFQTNTYQSITKGNIYVINCTLTEIIIQIYNDYLQSTKTETKICLYPRIHSNILNPNKAIKHCVYSESNHYSSLTENPIYINLTKNTHQSKLNP